MGNVGFYSHEDSEYIVLVLPLLLPADTQFLGFDFGAGVVPYGSSHILFVNYLLTSANRVPGTSVAAGPRAPRALWRLGAGRLQPWGCGAFWWPSAKGLGSTARSGAVLLCSLPWGCARDLRWASSSVLHPLVSCPAERECAALSRVFVFNPLGSSLLSQPKSRPAGVPLLNQGRSRFSSWRGALGCSTGTKPRFQARCEKNHPSSQGGASHPCRVDGFGKRSGMVALVSEQLAC